MRRLLQGGLIVLLMSVAVFVGVYAIGNPVDILINPDATQAVRAAAIARLGLDQPLPLQYLNFLIGALHGDLGASYVYNVPAFSLILDAMPATMELAFSSIIVALGVGIPLGIWAGYRPDGFSTRLIMGGSLLGFSLPTFWVGLVLIVLFSVQAGWLPSGGRGDTITLLGVQVSFLTRDGLAHLVMPAITLALFEMALVIRLTRAGMAEALTQEYIRFARAKGLRESRVLGVHAFANVLLPLVTVLGVEFGGVIAFAVVTETVFAWPGMGKLIIDSIGVLDRPVIVAYLMLTAVLFVAINLVVDIAYLLLDPRVRVTGTR